MDLADRKLRVLNAIVEIYVQSGEPVSSKAVCDFLNISVSTATIRNDMAELVSMGLLEQPHTSAGRVPSHLGYREYINNLRSHDFSRISSIDRDLINSSLSSANDPEHLLEEASQVLADITKFVAISTAPPGDNSTIRKIDFVQTGRHSAMIVIITSSGLIKNKLFKSEYEITPDILRVFYLVTNEKFAGALISSITSEFIRSMLLSLGELAPVLLPAMEAILESAQEILGTSINLDGQNNLLFVPSFNIDEVRKIMEFLDHRDEIMKLILQKEFTNRCVLIGLESERPELSDSSIIISRYTIGGKSAGAIAIIGPTRMNYKKAITNLEYLTKTVGKILSNILEF